MINMIRQGDVLLIRREAPAEAKKIESRGLRVPGERTGHAHVLEADVFEQPDGTRLLALSEPSTLSHEEHAPIQVPEGWWEPRLQREFSPSSRPALRMRFD